MFSAGSGGIWNSGLSSDLLQQVVKVHSNALEFAVSSDELRS